MPVLINHIEAEFMPEDIQRMVFNMCRVAGCMDSMVRQIIEVRFKGQMHTFAVCQYHLEQVERMGVNLRVDDIRAGVVRFKTMEGEP